MFFFKSPPGGRKRPISPGHLFRPMLEALETRELPEASPFFAAYEFALASRALLGSTSGDPGSCNGGGQAQTRRCTGVHGFGHDR